MISSKFNRLVRNASARLVSASDGIAIQALESRTLFSTVWTGAGGSTSWSNPLNWNPQAEPDASSDVVFPAGVSQNWATNDHQRSVHSIRLDAPYTISDSVLPGPSLIVAGGISTTYSTGSSTIIASVELAASQTISVANNYLKDPDVRFAGGISDGGHHYGLNITGGGKVMIGNGGYTYTGPTNIISGNFQVYHTSIASDITVQAGGVFSGDGTIRKLTALSGSLVQPGIGTAGIVNSGDLTLNSGSKIELELHGASPDQPYDQFIVTGAVSLDGVQASFSMAPNFPAAVGDHFTLIQNDGADPIVGTFAGLAEGTQINVGTNRFRISYVGGTGNDLVLTALAPATTALTGTLYTNTYGSSRTFTAAVTGGYETPTGIVTLMDGATVLATQSLDGTGHATFNNITTVQAGSRSVTAVYAGNGRYANSTSNVATVSVTKDLAVTTIVATDSSAYFGQPAEFKATVVGQLGGHATGQVVFSDGSTMLSIVPLDDAGVATAHLSTLGIGHHSISAVYSGDSNLWSNGTSAAPIDILNNLPTTSGLSNVDVNNGLSQSVIDLGPAFADAETADANLIFTITANTNSSLVTTSINSQILTLQYAQGVVGSADLTVRATDANGAYVETTFNAGVSYIPDAGTLQFASSAIAVSETPGTIDLMITRTDGSEGIASAHYAVMGGSATTDDYTLAAGVVSFGDGEVSKSITVALNNDAIDEDDETVVVTLSNPSGVTTLGAVAATTLTIHDNAAPTVGDLTEDHRPGHGIAPSPMYTASDPDGDPLTLSIVTPPSNGTATVGKHPSGDYILYYPAPTLYGDDSVVYQVDDGHGHTATGTLHLSTLGAGIVDSAISPGLKDLVAIGGEGDDDIEFYAWKNTKEVKVMIGDGQLGHYPVTGRVLAFGMGGNDTIRARYIKQSVIFSGGDGNDRLIGSGGKDILVGGNGNDRLQGYEKMDLFIGGNGADRIDGGAPDDIAIGGTSAFDALATADQLSLIDISNAWNGSGKRTARQNQIRAGVGTRLAKLDNTTVFADNDIDDLGKITTKNWIYGDTPGGVTAGRVRGRRAA